MKLLHTNGTEGLSGFNSLRRVRKPESVPKPEDRPTTIIVTILEAKASEKKDLDAERAFARFALRNSAEHTTRSPEL